MFAGQNHWIFHCTIRHNVISIVAVQCCAHVLCLPKQRNPLKFISITQCSFYAVPNRQIAPYVTANFKIHSRLIHFVSYAVCAGGVKLNMDMTKQAKRRAAKLERTEVDHHVLPCFFFRIRLLTPRK